MSKIELMERLRVFMPHIASTEVNYLAGQGSFTKEKLHKLLLHGKQPTEPYNMDKEAWGVLDPHGRGMIDVSNVFQLLQKLPGLEQMDEQDMNVVRTLLKMDKYGRLVTVENLQQLGTWAPKLEELTPVQRRILAARSGKGAAKAARS